MEKIKNIALIVLGVLVIWLFIDRYAISKCTATVAENKTTVETTNDSISKNINIAYVNIDSVLLTYEQSVKMNEDFMAKRQKSENEFTKKAKQFEKDYLAFQEKAQRGGFLSQASMEMQQRELLEQKERLDNLEAKLTEELMIEQQRLNEILYEAIVSYVERYNMSAGYDLILTNTGLGTIMHGNPNLNITNEIVEGLNAEYRAAQNK